jgi:hypothetical protein
MLVEGWMLSSVGRHFGRTCCLGNVSTSIRVTVEKTGYSVRAPFAFVHKVKNEQRFVWAVALKLYKEG